VLSKSAQAVVSFNLPIAGDVINAAVIVDEERNLQFTPRQAGPLVMSLLSYEKWTEAISSEMGASLKGELDRWRKESEEVNNERGD